MKSILKSKYIICLMLVSAMDKNERTGKKGRELDMVHILRRMVKENLIVN